MPLDPLVVQVLENERLRLLAKCQEKKRRKPKLKTHCRRGHPYSAKNTRIYRYGSEVHRQCLSCLAIRRELDKELESKRVREALRLLRKYGMPLSARQVKREAAA